MYPFFQFLPNDLISPIKKMHLHVEFACLQHKIHLPCIFLRLEFFFSLIEGMHSSLSEVLSLSVTRVVHHNLKHHLN